MKPLAISLFALLLLAGSFPASAQSDMIIKQRAKQIRDANNAQQGVPPPAPPQSAPAPTPSTPGTNTGISPEQQRNLDRLAANLAAIKAGVPVTAEQKEALHYDLLRLSKANIKPSTESLAKLIEDLSAGFSHPNVTVREQGQLAKAINVVVNAASVTSAQAQSFIVVAQTALKSSHVSDPDYDTITADLKAIVAEVEKAKPKLYQ